MANQDAPISERMATQLRAAESAINALMRRRGNYLEVGEAALDGIGEVLGEYAQLHHSSDTPKTHAVHLLLGELEVGQQAGTFLYETEAECAAFRDGVMRAVGTNDYCFCAHADMVVMADREIRSLPAGVDADTPVVLYGMSTADGCSKRITYGLGQEGRLVEINGGAWSPSDPVEETLNVVIEVYYGGSDSTAEELTGDQHRALECGGMLDQYLELLAKRDPDGANELLGEVAQEGMRP
jgi:hypothetical protein